MSNDIGKGALNRSTKKYDWFPDTGKFAPNPDANPKAPDYYGKLTLTIQGQPVTLRLSGWARRGQDGKPGFLSLAAEYDRQETNRLAIQGAGQAAAPASAKPAQPEAPQFDEDLPF